MAHPQVPFLAVLAAKPGSRNTIVGMLEAFDVAAYNARSESSPGASFSNQEWIAARLAANDGTTLKLIASPLMWNEYADGGVFLGEPRVYHSNPREVMLVAATMI